MKQLHKTILSISILIVAGILTGCGEKSDVQISEQGTAGPSSSGQRPGTPGGPPATPDAHAEKKGAATGASGSRPGM